MESSIDMAYVTFLLFLVLVERRVTGVKTIKTLIKQQELITKQAEKINLYMKFQMKRLEFRQNNFCIECSKIIPNQQTHPGLPKGQQVACDRGPAQSTG